MWFSWEVKVFCISMLIGWASAEILDFHPWARDQSWVPKISRQKSGFIWARTFIKTFVSFLSTASGEDSYRPTRWWVIFSWPKVIYGNMCKVPNLNVPALQSTYVTKFLIKILQRYKVPTLYSCYKVPYYNVPNAVKRHIWHSEKRKIRNSLTGTLDFKLAKQILHGAI